MKYDDAIRLCNGTRGQSIQDMLYGVFNQVQAAETGSYADRERAFLIGMGCVAGSRTDMWKEYLNSPWSEWSETGDFITTFDYSGDVIAAAGTDYSRARVVKRDGSAECQAVCAASAFKTAG
jgi:hypothetical protein